MTSNKQVYTYRIDYGQGVDSRAKKDLGVKFDIKQSIKDMLTQIFGFFFIENDVIYSQ